MESKTFSSACGTATADETITVGNQNPTATADSYTAPSGTAVTLTPLSTDTADSDRRSKDATWPASAAPPCPPWAPRQHRHRARHGECQRRWRDQLHACRRLISAPTPSPMSSATAMAAAPPTQMKPSPSAIKILPPSPTATPRPAALRCLYGYTPLIQKHKYFLFCIYHQ